MMAGAAASENFVHCRTSHFGRHIKDRFDKSLRCFLRQTVPDTGRHVTKLALASR